MTDTTDKLYRVRDRNDLHLDGSIKTLGTVWGANLSYDDAATLCRQVLSARKSKTARVEAMDADLDEPRPLSQPPAAKPAKPAKPTKPAKPNTLDMAKQNAKIAAANAAGAAQKRHLEISMSDPPKPPPSPLTDEVVDDLDDNPDAEDILGVDGLSDIIGGVGAATDDDKKKAVQDAESSAEAITRKAKKEYALACTAQGDAGPWPRWDQLGEFEWSGWRFYAQHGGVPPALTKQARKVEHAGVSGGAVETETE